MPPSFDQQYTGLYNARRDSLTSRFWQPEFGKTHAVFLVSSFFENVQRDGRNKVAHFTPNDGREMVIACLYSEWGNPDEDGFLSFAAITDEPPPEVSAAGPDRMIIRLDDPVIEDWLSPYGKSNEELQTMLDVRAKSIYEHELLDAAA